MSVVPKQGCRVLLTATHGVDNIVHDNCVYTQAEQLITHTQSVHSCTKPRHARGGGAGCVFWVSCASAMSASDIQVEPSGDLAQDEEEEAGVVGRGVDLVVAAPRVQNVVTTLTTGASLHLPTVVQRLSASYGCEYNPKRFAAVTMRIRERSTLPGATLTATALFFRSGKIVCTGARSVAQSRWALIRFVKILRSVGFPTSMRGYQVQNIVGSTSVGAQVNLDAMAAANVLQCNYEPQQFPGLVFRVKEQRQVCLVFQSGELVITGAKRTHQLVSAFNKVLSVLKQFVQPRDCHRLSLSSGVPDSDDDDDDDDNDGSDRTELHTQHPRSALD